MFRIGEISAPRESRVRGLVTSPYSLESLLRLVSPVPHLRRPRGQPLKGHPASETRLSRPGREAKVLLDDGTALGKSWR